MLTASTLSAPSWGADQCDGSNHAGQEWATMCFAEAAKAGPMWLVSTDDLRNGMVDLLPGTQDFQHCVLQGKSVLCWLGEDGRVSKYSTTEEKMDDLQEL